MLVPTLWLGGGVWSNYSTAIPCLPPKKRTSQKPSRPPSLSLSLFSLAHLFRAEFASFGPGGDAEVPAPAAPKSEEARQVLSDALRKHFLFAQLTPADLSACVDVMGEKAAAEGESIVVQGDRGSRFFVVKEGLVEVRFLGWEGT